MPYLSPDQFERARPLFAAFTDYHLCAPAVLAGSAPGQVWVDDPDHPRVGFLTGSEGSYLGGDPTYEAAYPALREVIPHDAYLLAEPSSGWQAALPRAWANIAARPHRRQHYVYRQPSAPDWRPRVPEGLRVAMVDADLYAQAGLENHNQVMDWITGWRSPEDFLARGVGACVLHQGTIAAWCLMDCNLGERCELGIVTDRRYRRQGLGSLATAAALEACLARGYREVGWQCFRTNHGSVGVARRNGFELERDYLAFSSWMPIDNPSDMTAPEYEDWARHYELCAASQPGWSYLAAEAWALAGRRDEALAQLRALLATGWKGQREWFAGWPFDSLRGEAEFNSLTAALAAEPAAAE